MASEASEAVGARRARAIAAAVDAGRALGLEVGEPAVLHEGFSVVVHLAPSPVVVRVPTVLPAGVALETHTAQQAREVAVVAWLDRIGGAPREGVGIDRSRADRAQASQDRAQAVRVVRPSPLAPPQPVVRDGFSMTLWEKVEVDREATADFVANAARVAELHAALASCPVALSFMHPMTAVEPALAFMRAHPEVAAAGDVEKASREWALLGPVLSSREAFEARFPRARVQPIHGDAPCYNLVTVVAPRGDDARVGGAPGGDAPANERALHADFEHACLGTVEWDLAGFGAEIQGAYDHAAKALGLRALDPEVLRVMEAARNLQLVACLPIAPQFPGLLEAIGPMLDAWRATTVTLD